MTDVDSYKVDFSPDLYSIVLKKQQDEINSLRQQLRENNPLKATIEDIENPTKKKIPYPKKREHLEYTEIKGDGKNKPHKAESIRSYDDFKAFQNYFLKREKIRDYALWTIGVALGLRISDLVYLRYKHFFEEDKKTYRDRLKVIEQKTSKLNDILITEACKQALNKLIESNGGEFEYGDYIFTSRKGGNRMETRSCWRIISQAGKELGMPFSCGSHTMRKSFANIAACVDDSIVDMNSIVKIQGLLNHSDPRITMRYLDTFSGMYDRARVAVSDFILGRTEVNELIAGQVSASTKDLLNKLEDIEAMLKGSEDD